MGGLKTSRIVLENRVAGPAQDDCLTLAWLARHTACLYNGYHIEQDGRAPWRIIAGTLAMAAAAELGEGSLLLTKGPNKERHWQFGICWGLVTHTQEAYLVAPEGVV